VEEGQDGRSDDPFEQLLDPGFVAGAARREPSAEERRRAAERQARAADLQRRLVAEKTDQRRYERTLRRRDRRARRKQRGASLLALLLLAALIGAVAWFQSNGRSAGGPIGGQARPAGFPPVDESASPVPLNEPPPAPLSAGAYEFLQSQPNGGGPVAWDPCRPIRYVINPAGAPPEGDALLRDALQRTANATGLQFVDSGATTEIWSKDRESFQPDRYGDRWAPVLVTWSTEQATPDLAGYIAGFAGPTSVSDPEGRSAFVSGSVVLDATDITGILATPGGAAKARAVIQHELGHLVGLGHVADSAQLMYSENTDEQTGDWGTGDLAGLTQLGRGECFPDL
jgi:hypothetical protein